MNQDFRKIKSEKLNMKRPQIGSGHESKNSTITSSGVVADYFAGSTLDRFELPNTLLLINTIRLCVSGA